MQFSVLAAVVVGVASIVLGFIWYGPLLFGKLWAKLIGFTDEDLKRGSPVMYLLPVVSGIVMGGVTSYLVLALGITAALDGIALGLLLGVGYITTSFATNYFFQRKNVRLFLLDAGYQVLNVVIAGLITTLVR